MRYIYRFLSVPAFILLMPVVFVNAGSLNNVSVVVETPYTSVVTAGESATYLFNFDVVTSVPSGGRIDMTFPQHYGIRIEQGVTCNLFGPNDIVEGFIVPNPDGSLTASVEVPYGESVVPSPSGYPGALNTCWVEVINPLTTGLTGGFSIYTYDTTGQLLDHDTTIGGQVVIPADTTTAVSISITSPVVGESITAGSQDYPIMIERTGVREITHIAIFQSLDGGITWMPLDYIDVPIAVFSASGYNDSQQMFAWDVPNTVTSLARVKAVAYGVQYGIPIAEYEMPGNLNIVATVAQGTGNILPDVPVRSLVKASLSAVYYYAEDGRRYVFPSESVFFSWYENFDSVITITDEQLASLPIGNKRITMRSGTWLIKIQSDPTVYAVEQGTKRPIVDEVEATALYGPNWNQRIVDIAPTFFSDYKLSRDLDLIHPWGTILEYNDQHYMAQGDGGGYGTWFELSPSEFINMRVQSRFILPVSSDMGYVLGVSPSDIDFLNTYRYWTPTLAY